MKLLEVWMCAGFVVCSVGISHAQQIDPGTRLLKEKKQTDIAKKVAAGQPGTDLAAKAPTLAKSEFCFPIKQINLTGVTKLSQKDIVPVTGPLQNSCLGQSEVEFIIAALTNRYKEKGFITTQVYIPEQDLTKGTLTLSVVEGRIEKIEHTIIGLDGVAKLAPRRKTTSAFPNVDGEVLQLRAIEQGVSQINSAGVSKANVDIAPGTNPGESIIKITEQRGRKLRLSSTTEIGAIAGQKAQKRQSLQLNAGDLFRLNERWSASYAGTADSNALAASLVIPYGYWNFGINGSLSDQSSFISPIAENITQSASFGLSADRIVWRNTNYILHLNQSASYYANQRYINITELSPQSDISTRSGISLESYFDGKQSYFDVGSTVGQQTIGEGTDKQSKNYFKLDASLTASYQINPASIIQLTSNGQLSSNYLPSNQQISIGGFGSVRGFLNTSAAGDSGLVGKLEYQRAINLPAIEEKQSSKLSSKARNAFANSLSGYAFLDAGYVHNNNEKSDSHAFSAGFGARLAGTRTSLDVGIAIPISSSTNMQSGVTATLSLTTRLW